MEDQLLEIIERLESRISSLESFIGQQSAGRNEDQQFIQDLKRQLEEFEEAHTIALDNDDD